MLTKHLSSSRCRRTAGSATAHYPRSAPGYSSDAASHICKLPVVVAALTLKRTAGTEHEPGARAPRCPVGACSGSVAGATPNMRSPIKFLCVQALPGVVKHSEPSYPTKRFWPR
jgi:hypothetical protein